MLSTSLSSHRSSLLSPTQSLTRSVCIAHSFPPLSSNMTTSCSYDFKSLFSLRFQAPHYTSAQALNLWSSSAQHNARSQTQTSPFADYIRGTGSITTTKVINDLFEDVSGILLPKTLGPPLRRSLSCLQSLTTRSLLSPLRSPLLNSLARVLSTLLPPWLQLLPQLATCASPHSPISPRVIVKQSLLISLSVWAPQVSLPLHQTEG